MINNRLEEHIRQSKIAVSANKAKGNRHAELLSSIYTSPSKFIDELLQNAEDACRKLNDSTLNGEIKFSLYEDRLEMIHQGKAFDVEDLMAITTFANTTKDKQNQFNLIGKFGIGFKSVFQISKQPEIHSANYHFKIVDYEVLLPIKEKKIPDGCTTLFVFPLKKEKQLFEKIASYLLSINYASLLFLDALTSINISINRKEIFQKQIKRNELVIDDKLNLITIEDSSINAAKQFYCFRKQCSLLKKRWIKIAYECENEKHFVLNDNCLFNYFESKTPSGLNFIVQAPFTTTSTRELIPFDDSAPENLKLLKELKLLFIHSLKYFNKNDSFNLDFLRLFDQHQLGSITNVQSTFHSALIVYMESYRVLKDGNANKRCLRDLCICTDEKLKAYLKKKHLTVFWKRNAFLSNEYLEELKMFKFLLMRNSSIPEITIESLSLQIKNNKQFLFEMTIAELKSFYLLIKDYPHLWNLNNKDKYFSLRDSLIMPDQQKKYYLAFDENSESLWNRKQIYKGSKKHLLHSSFAKEERLFAFYNDLGLFHIQTTIQSNDLLIAVKDICISDVIIEHPKKEINQNGLAQLVLQHQKLFTNERGIDEIQLWANDLFLKYIKVKEYQLIKQFDLTNIFKIDNKEKILDFIVIPNSENHITLSSMHYTSIFKNELPLYLFVVNNPGKLNCSVEII